MSSREKMKAAFSHHQRGNLAVATRYYGEILAKEPRHFDALHLSGLAAFQQGDMARAAELLGRANEVNPDHPDCLCHMGCVAMEQGASDAAVAALSRAIELQPDHVNAQYNLGYALARRGDLDGAAAAFRRVLELEPGAITAHNDLGVVLARADRPDDAAAEFRKVIAHQPDNAGAHVNLGNTLRDAGDHDGALAAFDSGLTLAPDHADAHYNQGLALKDLGRREAAVAAFRKAIALQPDATDAHYNLAHNKRFEAAGDPDIAAIEDLLDRPETGEQARIRLSFALAKAYEDAGDFDRSFGHLATGNGLKRQSIDYDIARDEGDLDRIAAAFGGTPAADGSFCASTVPIFVLGMPRTGTTLVEQILASHSAVYGAGERRELPHLVDGLGAANGARYPESAAGLDRDALSRLGEEYVAGVSRLAPGSARVVDKMPPNFRFIDLIRMILPNAKVILCLRDPADACFSCYAKLFNTGLEYTYDLAELGRYHRAHDRMIRACRERHGDWILDVRYESLIADPEREIRRLVEFCELDWEDACLAFHETERAAPTSTGGVRRPVYDSSIGRWKRFAGHLGPLLEALEGG